MAVHLSYNNRRTIRHYGWLLLLIPCLFLIRCNKDVTIKVITPSGQRVEGVTITITYTEHQLLKNWRLLYSKTHHMTGKTDTDGVVTFPNQPFSAFDWVAFHTRNILIEARKGEAYAKKCCCFFKYCSRAPYCIRLNYEKKNDEKKKENSEEEKEEIEDNKDYKIVILTYCHDNYVNLNDATQTLIRHGFTVVEYMALFGVNPEGIRSEIDDDNCQLWIISDSERHISDGLCEVVYEHFNNNRGLFIWSDNYPYFADTNVLLEHLFGSKMSGNYQGDQIVKKQSGGMGPGMVEHEITKGLDELYEGVTISNIKITEDLNPLVYSSDVNVVTAYYDKNGKRVLIDGGFTRLFINWDSNTATFVVNCACWLARKHIDK